MGIKGQTAVAVPTRNIYDGGMISHLDDLLARIPALTSCSGQISSAFELFHASYLAGGKLLLCGNGGSAADSEHWAGELLKGFMHPRKLSAAKNPELPEDLLNRLQWALPAIPLTGFPAFATAFANDVEPGLIFAQLVLGLGKPGDVLVGISTSGNSKNVCHAARVARARGIKVVALTGESGGNLKGIADVCIAVPATRTPQVQEYHLPIYHCLSLMLEDAWAEINS
jgi:D-sedoheptulose 7-phosphate isomerase